MIYESSLEILTVNNSVYTETDNWNAYLNYLYERIQQLSKIFSAKFWLLGELTHNIYFIEICLNSPKGPSFKLDNISKK